MTLSENHYRRIYPYRSRGLESLMDRVGDVRAQIERRLSEDRRSRVLEVGAGFGTALLQLQTAYPGVLELFGINRRRSDGDHVLMLRNARERSIAIVESSGVPVLPIISYCDVGEGIPFPDGYFDLIFS